MRKRVRKNYPINHGKALILANGGPAAWQSGQYVSTYQAEWYQMGTAMDDDPAQSADERRYAGIDWQIGVAQIDDGMWLASPPGLGIWDPRFPTREAALRHAVASVVRRARFRARLNRDTPTAFYMHIGADELQTVIGWAYRVLGRPARVVRKPSPAPKPCERHPVIQQSLFGQEEAA